MARYITNKQVNNVMANDLKNLKGMGDTIWKFISLVYEAKWDSLYTDNKSPLLEQKFPPNSLQGLCWTQAKITRKLQNRFWSPLKKFCLHLPFWLNQRRKSMSSQNTSKATNQWQTPRNWPNLMLRPQNKQLTLLKCSRSRNHSPLSMQSKSIRSTTLSKTTQSQNPASRWSWKNHPESKSSFQWAATTTTQSWKTQQFMWQISTNSSETPSQRSQLTTFVLTF